MIEKLNPIQIGLFSAGRLIRPLVRPNPWVVIIIHVHLDTLMLVAKGTPFVVEGLFIIFNGV